MPSLHVVGAGGHAKVVVATARAAGWTVESVSDDREERWGTSLLGVPVRGPTSAILSDPTLSVIIAIGDNATRLALASAARCRFVTLRHPSAVIDSSVTLGVGSVVFAGVVIQPDTSIGDHVIVNTSTSVDHDCTLENGVHLAPGVRLAGGVVAADGAFIGVGASVIPGIRIGANAIVGAGAVVIHHVTPGTTVVGVPAKLIRNG